VYYLKTQDLKELYKVKGLTKDSLLTQKDFEALLNKNTSLIKSQDKWYKDISKGHIIVRNEVYTLQQTNNKQELIYRRWSGFQ